MRPAMPRRRDRAPAPIQLLTALLTLALPAAAAAQATATKGPVTTFASPDGTRFVLVADPSMRLVEWAVVTPADPADEPPGLEGLAAVVAKASLGGTWRTGSIDPERERQALDALDRAYHELLAQPRSPELQKRVGECEAAAAALGDPAVFPRVLAALPAHRPEIASGDGTSVLQLTTVGPAIAKVAQLLRERREEQALRDFGKTWLGEAIVRHSLYDADPAASVHAEVLALAMPSHPASRAAERPSRGMPQRAQALAVWQATQHPTRTVHALVGDFDPATARQVLCEVFQATALPPAPTAAPPALRPLQSLRRSTVPGVREPMVAVAWVLAESPDPHLLDAAVRWFANSPDSWLRRALTKAGRKSATVRARAPWPVVVGGNSLLLVDVVDPAGTQGLADLVVQQARLAVPQLPSAAELQVVSTAQHLAWNALAADRRLVAADLARAWLLQPQAAPRLGPPPPIDARAVQQLLSRTFASQPVVVEGRR